MHDWWTLWNQTSWNRWQTMFQSLQNPPWEASQLRGRYWNTQPAAVPESSKGLTFGLLFIRSRDDGLWSVLSIPATIRAESFWLTIQAAGSPAVGRGARPVQLQATALATKLNGSYSQSMYGLPWWPRCGWTVPDTQISALVPNITAQWGLPWCVRVAQVAAPPQVSLQCKKTQLLQHCNGTFVIWLEYQWHAHHTTVPTVLTLLSLSSSKNFSSWTLKM